MLDRNKHKQRQDPLSTKADQPLFRAGSSRSARSEGVEGAPVRFAGAQQGSHTIVPEVGNSETARIRVLRRGAVEMVYDCSARLSVPFFVAHFQQHF